MESGSRTRRIISSRLLALSESVQLVIDVEGAFEKMSTPVTAAALSQNDAHDVAPALKPIIVRLEKIPATTHNRKHVEDRIRELNRILEDSGNPFQLRLL
jgi:hypothetical protein